MCHRGAWAVEAPYLLDLLYVMPFVVDTGVLPVRWFKYIVDDLNGRKTYRPHPRRGGSVPPPTGSSVSRRRHEAD